MRLSARLKRGIDLAEERFDEIEKIVSPGPGRSPAARVSSSHVEDLKNGLCTCPDHPPEGEQCKHVSVASYRKAKWATCSGCKNRFRHRDLYEVHEDHGSLTWFPGDLLCEGCACDTGTL